MRRTMLALADVAVVVSNAKRSAAWWTKNLGLAAYTIGGSGHAILVAPPGDRFVLHLCEGFAPLEPGDSGIAFVTDAMDALVARMRAGAVGFPTPPTDQGWGRMAKFSDPDGNIFWLLEAPSAMVRATLRSRAPATAGRRAARRTARRAAHPRPASRRPPRVRRREGTPTSRGGPRGRSAASLRRGR
jgi:catechol 2,3-dioxygenase-like lactoylglutathione lyase family enzyme